jgi:hypothetical protein
LCQVLRKKDKPSRPQARQLAEALVHKTLCAELRFIDDACVRLDG